MRRASFLMASLAVAALSLAPSLADARAGSGTSSGSRGTRTYSAPPSTATAPNSAAPMERSITPRQAPTYGNAYNNAAPARSGGFASGLLGGLLGAGIGGLLFGHGLFGGGGGFGFIGFLLQLVILYFIARWLFRTFFNRPAVAGMGGGNFARMGQPAPGMMNGGTGGSTGNTVAIGRADYQAFEGILQEIQAAWSTGNLGRMQSLATPEMVGYFNEQLADLSRRGLRNSVTAVQLDKGDLSEAWREGNVEYATVAMRFSMIDVTQDASGRVVDGDPARRSSATELWTFTRLAGRNWLLSAIQQAR